MKNTKISVEKGESTGCEAELLIAFAGVGDNEKILCSEPALQSLAESMLGFAEFSAKKEQSLLLYPPYLGKDGESVSLAARRLLLLGIGKEDEGGDDSAIFDDLRQIGGVIAQKAKECKATSICLALDDFGPLSQMCIAEYLTEGILLGDYRFEKYKTKKSRSKKGEDDKPYPGLERITFCVSRQEKRVVKAVRRGESAAIATCAARDMANEPGCGWRPADFAAYAQRLAKNQKLECTVFDKKQLEKMKMGGILGVNQGSAEPPRLVVLEYRPEKATETILLVGKGLTFDSGGISLKPAQGMMDMKYDMCGGAAVLAVMESVAREKPSVAVVAIVPSTDNMSGAAALKPGDIITHYGGVTSEIENTDAEGRLILADALVYGIEKYKPDCVIDLATLTGAVIIALGHHHTGLLSNNDDLVGQLTDAGMLAGEPLWRLPLGKPYAKQIESQVADIKNTGGRPGGAITAAEYLHHFVGDVPWAHLDIAGTAWDFTEKKYIPKGPSGTGVRTLLNFLRAKGER